MIQFNPENKYSLTYRECLEPAMEITDQKEADKFYADYLKWQMRNGQSCKKADETIKINLGYYAGYYGDDVRKRVEKLFMCSHPIFGSIKDNGVPTGKEAFECGKENKTLSEIRKS